MGLLVSAARGVVPERFKPLAKKARQIAIRPRYRGQGVACPCCNGRFRAFRPGGVDEKRDGARCPGCGSWERHRLLWLFLEQRTSFFQQRVALLHVAPEPVLLERFASLPNVRVTSIDLRSPLADLRMDVSELLFAESYFDAVICVHVLEHVEDDRRAIRELHRVLRPGGYAIVISPVKRELTLEDPALVDPQQRERAYGLRDRVRAYGRDLGQRLQAAGFEVDVVPFARELDPAAVERYGLLLSEDIYFSRKPELAAPDSMLRALEGQIGASLGKRQNA